MAGDELAGVSEGELTCWWGRDRVYVIDNMLRGGDLRGP